MSIECYYFGVESKTELGHHLYDVHGRRWHSEPTKPFPIKISFLDMGLLGSGFPEVEGQSVHFWISGWTIVSFPDRSGDPRPGSNSAFVIRGKYNFGNAMACARNSFPKIFDRIKFPIILRADQENDTV